MKFVQTQSLFALAVQDTVFNSHIFTKNISNLYIGYSKIDRPPIPTQRTPNNKPLIYWLQQTYETAKWAYSYNNYNKIDIIVNYNMTADFWFQVATSGS